MNANVKRKKRQPKKDKSKKLFPVIGSEHANCEVCPLKDRLEAGNSCDAYIPNDWNGLMIVGEGPGVSEVAHGRPFVGRSGRLLRALLASHGIELERCYITNATMCLPPRGAVDKKGFMHTFSTAVHACLSRLEEEIAAVRPRVIIALGNTALAALTGYEKHYEKRVTLPACEHCGGLDTSERKVGGIMCSNKECKHIWQGDDEERPEACPAGCGKDWRKLKHRRVPCPECHGRKTAMEPRVAFLHDYKIMEVAGAVIPASDYGFDADGVSYIVPTYHPSFLLREGQGDSKKGMSGQFAAKPAQKHIHKAWQLLQQDHKWSVQYEVTHPTDLDDAADHVQEYFEAARGLTFSCDIETEAFYRDENGDWKQGDARKLLEVTKVKCIGFASTDKDLALVVDTRNMTPTDDDPLFNVLKRVLADPEIGKVFHHGNYDCTVMERLWGVRTYGFQDDTLIMHHTLYPDEKHSLAHVAFSYTYARIWKPPKTLKGAEVHEDWDEECEYNARDTMLTAQTRDRMRNRIDAKGLAACYDLSMKLQDQGLEMWRNGMPVNTASIQRVGNEAYERVQTATQEMRDLLDWDEFNPNSPDQLAYALFDIQDNPVMVVTDTGKPSTAKDALVKLKDSPFKRALLAQREAGATLRNYFSVDDNGVVRPDKSLHIWPDGKIRFVWQCFGTRTGRWSSNPNAQNWPKWLRALVEAPEGYKIVGADYDQLELRIMAALCGDEKLIHRCLTADETRKLDPDADPHSYVASVALGAAFTDLLMDDPAHDPQNERCSCEKCTRKALRDLCKRVIYALNYGSGDGTILNAIYTGGYHGPPITLQMIGKVRNGIFNAFPGIPEYQEIALRRANEEQAVFSPLLKRRRIFPLGEVPATEALNYPIQSGGADIINIRSTILFEQALKRFPQAKYMAQVHDAVYYLVPENQAEDFAELTTKSLSCKLAMYEGGPVVPFTAGAVVSGNWKDAG